MAFKLIVLCAALAVANAGYLGAPAAVSYGLPTLSYAAPAAITSQSANTYRSAGNLAQISTYSKTIDTPFSSVSKSDVRVSNPGVYATSYAAPAAYAYSAAPAVSHVNYGAPLSYAAAPAPYIAKAAYAAPAYAYSAAPAPYLAKAAYAAPTYAYSAAPAPYIAKAAYAAPAYAYSAAPAVAAPGPVVAHATFSGLGASYAW